MTELPLRCNPKYGWRHDLPDWRDHTYPTAVRPTQLPPSVDLRPHCPPVYDQSQIGSCTSQAIAGAFEFDLLKQGIQDFQPSRLFIYYNERAIEGSVRTDSGAQIRDGVKVVARLGVCSEALWPYDGDPANADGSWPTGHLAGLRPTAAAYAAATHNEAIEYARVNQDLNHLKSCLHDGYPVVFGFSVFESFESVEVSDTGVQPMPQSGEQLMGGHAVVLVGYDDEKQAFLVRNSWGTSWGISGCWWQPYAYTTNKRLASDFWTIRKVS